MQISGINKLEVKTKYDDTRVSICDKRNIVHKNSWKPLLPRINLMKQHYISLRCCNMACGTFMVNNDRYVIMTTHIVNFLVWRLPLKTYPQNITLLISKKIIISRKDKQRHSSNSSISDWCRKKYSWPDIFIDL